MENHSTPPPATATATATAPAPVDALASAEAVQAASGPAVDAPEPPAAAADPAPMRLGLLARLTGAESAVRDLENQVNVARQERDQARAQVATLSAERDRLQARAAELDALERTLQAEAPARIAAAVATQVADTVATLGVSPEALPAVQPEPAKGPGNDVRGLDRVAYAINATLANQ